MKTKLILTLIIFFWVWYAKAQNTGVINSPNGNDGEKHHYTSGAEAEAADERYSFQLDSLHIMDVVEKATEASKADMNLFYTYYADTLNNDIQKYFMEAGNSILSHSDLEHYALGIEKKYILFYRKLQDIKEEFPSTIAEYTLPRSNFLPPVVCNPACTNIGFETGDLSGWNGYDATNNSTALAMSYTGATGGACGAVTKAALDNTINAYKNNTTYQLTITSGAGNDPIAGPAIPIVAPGGGSYSCRIGDSSEGGSRVGILQQTFQVSTTNDNFTYQYAVLIDQATHSYGQQPYFSVTIIDQTTGDTLPCGVYTVISGGSAPPGFDSTLYTIPSYGWTDMIYYKSWTSVFVPLQNYIGHCVSVQATVSDCFPTRVGPHFCYAYFDASCAPLSVVSSSTALCGGNDTLIAPSGGTYVWAGPCIVGSTTNQDAIVGCAGTYTVTITSPDGCSDTLQKVVTLSSPMTLTTSSINGGCSVSGSATVSIAGGTTPYTYSWSNGTTTSTDSGLSSGTYTITVTDNNGCSQTSTASISNSGGITVSIGNSTNLVCFGGTNGSANANVAGGTAPYTYSWSPSSQTNSIASGLSAGSYTIFVTDANGCTGSAAITITQPTAITINTTTIAANCNQSNGSASSVVTGGTGPYIYSWSPGGNTNSSVTGLSASTYTLTITDANGCTQSTTAVVSNSNGVTTSISSFTNISCFNGANGSATVSAVGGTPPYTYLVSV